jgi:hypothetical protein
LKSLHQPLRFLQVAVLLIHQKLRSKGSMARHGTALTFSCKSLLKRVASSSSSFLRAMVSSAHFLSRDSCSSITKKRQRRRGERRTGRDLLFLQAPCPALLLPERSLGGPQLQFQRRELSSSGGELRLQRADLSVLCLVGNEELTELLLDRRGETGGEGKGDGGGQFFSLSLFLSLSLQLQLLGPLSLWSR